MDTKGRLVAGSHNRNEFVLINADEIGRVSAQNTYVSLLFIPSISQTGFGFQCCMKSCSA